MLAPKQNISQTKKPLAVKLPKSLFRTRKSSIPALRFESQSLSSYSGLVVFQKLFGELELSKRLSGRSPRNGSNGHASFSLLFRLLVVNALLGVRKLREVDLYREDPVVRRTLGMEALPSVPTISRMLESCDSKSVSALQVRSREIVLERLAIERLSTITLDFDGSVISTSRKAEGVASGYNKKKGMRSYYPLFCTLAQSGQALDLLHRSGDVHDSRGAVAFVEACVRSVRQAAPGARIETRMDSAFFSDEMVRTLDALGVEYAISVPFERFAELKGLIEQRRRWSRAPGGRRESEAFEKSWKPKSWKREQRFLFVRSANPKQAKGALQLDIFEPPEYEYAYKCVITNKRCSIMAHNLNRELQMRAWTRDRPTTEKRSPLWIFEKIQTMRNALICKAGRFTRPPGKPTLTLNANPIVEQYMSNYLDAA